MSTLKVNEMRHLSNTGTANLVLESNATTNLQTTTTLGLTVNGTLTVTGVSTFTGNTVVGNASTDTLLLTSTVSGSANFSGFTGEIRMYAGNAAGDSPPAGWLYCNGDSINQTSGTSPDHHNSDGTGNDYQPLYNLLKASADWGNTGSLTWGTNNVKVPDFRSKSPVGVHTGASTSIGAGLTARTLSDSAGTETHIMVEAEMPSHTHVITTPSNKATSITINSHTHTQPTHTHNFNGNSNNTGGHTHTFNAHHGGSSGNYISSTNWHGLQYTPSTSNAGSHSHTVSGTTAASGADTSGGTAPGITDPGHGHTITAAVTPSSSANAHTILSPIIAVHYIIKV